MNINLKIRFTYDTKHMGKVVVCFRHAIQAANRGEDIELEIDDFSGDIRNTRCEVCHRYGS